MNSTIFPSTTNTVHARCASLIPLKDISLYFCLPLAVAVLVLFIVPAVLFLIRTPKRKTGRFQLQLKGRQDGKWQGQEKMRVKLVGIRRGDRDECLECQWKEFDNFSNEQLYAVFEDKNGRFKELTAACFVLPREGSDVLEQCEKSIETCVIKDFHTGVWYSYNTSSRLSSFNTTSAESVEPEHRIVFVRLHKVGSTVETTIRGVSTRCAKFLKLVFQSYWFLTSPFLCTNHTKLTYFDQSTLLVSKVLLAVVTVAMLQVFVPPNRLPFRHFFRNFKYTLSDFTLDGDGLYISTVAALLSFIGSMPVEFLLRLIRSISTNERSTTESTIKVPATVTCSKKEPSVDQRLFEEKPTNHFQLETTFKNVLEELKVRLVSIGLKKSYSNCSRGLTVSSRKAQGSGTQLYRELHENDSFLLDKETIQLESIPHDQMESPTRSLPGTGQPMSSKEPRTAAPIPYKRKDHIYAEIDDDVIAVNNETIKSSASGDQESGENPPQPSCPSLVQMALDDQKDRRQNWLDTSFQNLAKFGDPSVVMDIDTMINFKKDCRQSRYKGANQNSSCAANPLPTSSSLESTEDDTLDKENPSTNTRHDTKQVGEVKHTNKMVASPCAAQRNNNITTENLTWCDADSERNGLTCNLKDSRMYLNNWTSNSFVRPQVTLAVEGEYRQFAHGDCYTATQDEDTLSTMSSSKMVKYRDVLTRGIKIKKALLIRGKNYIDNFRDMSKAIVRSLSLSSVGHESVATSSSPNKDDFLTEKAPERKCSSSIPSLTVSDGLPPLAPMQRGTIKRTNNMAKIIHHGVTIAQPEEESQSILHRIKLWLSNILVNTKAQSDQSGDTDTDVGCMANMTSKDVTRRQNLVSGNRKQIVSETFTYVTMDSTLLGETLHLPDSSIPSKQEAMPDVVQTSIFKGMANSLPFKQPSFLSASLEEAWRTSPEMKGERKFSKNRNNNMNKISGTLAESSSDSSLRDGKILQTELTQLLANPFPEIRDDASSVAPNSFSSQTILEQLDKVAPWNSSTSTSPSPSPEPIRQIQPLELGESNIAHKYVKFQHVGSLSDKVLFLCLLILCITAIVCSTFSVSYLCRQQLQHLWILIVISIMTHFGGFDLVKAFIMSCTHLIWFPHKW